MFVVVERFFWIKGDYCVFLSLRARFWAEMGGLIVVIQGGEGERERERERERNSRHFRKKYMLSQILGALVHSPAYV